MATETEIKKLNKTVDEAVKLLKSGVGNTAQAKANNEKEREAVDKFSDATDRQEDIQDREEDLVETKTKDRQVAMKVFSTAKGLFNSAMVHIKGVFSEVKSQFLGLFGEESEWFGMLGAIKDSITGFFGWFIQGFTFFLRRTPSYARKTNEILGSMLGMMQKDEKMDALAGGQKKGMMGFLGVLGLVLVAAAAILGAFIRRAILPFQAMLKVLKVGPALKAIKTFFTTKWPVIGRFFKRIGDFFIKHFGKNSKLLTKIPFFGKIAKAFMKGFSKLFLPLTILLSAIDFIRGFIGSEGTFTDKLIGGIKGAVHGFFDVFIEMISWLVEKVAGWFGIELEGTAKTIKGWIDWAIDNVFKGWQLIFENIGDFFTWAGEMIDPVMKNLLNAVGYFVDIMKNLWNSVMDFFAGPKVRRVLRFFGVNMPEKIDEEPTGDSAMSKTIDLNKRRALKQEEKDKKIQDAMDKQTQATLEGNKKQDEVISSVSMLSQKSAAGGGGGGEVKQVPDELDNYIMDIKNYGGDFD